MKKKNTLDLGSYIQRLLERGDGYDGVVNAAKKELLRGKPDRAAALLKKGLPESVQAFGCHVVNPDEDTKAETPYIVDADWIPDFIEDADISILEAKEPKPKAVKAKEPKPKAVKEPKAPKEPAADLEPEPKKKGKKAGGGK